VRPAGRCPGAGAGGSRPAGDCRATRVTEREHRRRESDLHDDPARDRRESTAAEVWARIGKYCDIGEWLQIPAGCKMLSGAEGEVGSVRSVANEVLVGKTQYSYTYTQTVRAGRPYNLYHGTLEVRPVTDKTSKIIYTLMYDNSMLADDAAREKDKVGRTGDVSSGR
jgi:hypothetical protein